ncbi:MAG: hypothetical protein Q9184_004950 [Pyrenodesmia sp. 2 TL-2023]
MISHPAFIGTLSLFSLIFTFTHASPVQPRDRPARGLHPRQAADYTSNGCYTEATRGRALSGNAYFDNLMTVEKCAAACSRFTLFGLEYGRECFCGNTLNEGSVPAPSEQCSFKCPGNPDQKCGAGQRLNVYERVVTAPVVTAPAPSTYSAEGCYTEATTGRALSGKTYYDNAMTTAKCASACSGFDLFGLEYYRECYCGNRLQAGSVPAPSTECKYRCTGDQNEICGGDNRLNLYAFGTGTTVTPPVSTPKPYTFDGCFTEATRGRALTGSVFYDDAMTVEKCSAVCKGFTLFGLEYGRECYCGDTLQAGSQMTLESECNFVCPGNDAESCGAGNRLDVYRYGPATTTSSSSSTSSLTATSSLAISISSSMTSTETSTTSSEAQAEATTTGIEPETTTTSIEPETTTTSIEPEITTTSVEAETATTSVETTTTSSVEAEITSSSIEPETTITISFEAEITTTSNLEPETTTGSVEAQTTTTSSIEAEITITSVDAETTTTTSVDTGTTISSSIEPETTTTSIEVPTLSFEVPTTTIEIPTTSIEVPTTTIEIPTTSIEVPTTSIEVPATSIEVPTLSFGVPTTTIGISTTIIETPATSTETTATSTLAITTSTHFVNFNIAYLNFHLSHNDLFHNNLSHDDLSHNNLSHDDLSHNDLSHNDLSHNDLSHNDLDNFFHFFHDNFHIKHDLEYNISDYHLLDIDIISLHSFAHSGHRQPLFRTRP